MELPVSTLIVVIVAVIILLAVVAMYFTGFSPFSTAVGLEGSRSSACRVLVQEKRCGETTNNIEISNFDSNKDNNINPGSNWVWGTTTCGNGDDNLASLCACFYSVNSESSCKSLCGCTGALGGGGSSPPAGCDNDGVCDAGETFAGCPSDCFCNNDGGCDPAQGETNANCPADCGGGGCNWESLVFPSPGCIGGGNPGQCIVFVLNVPRIGVQSVCDCGGGGGSCIDSNGNIKPEGNNACICNSPILCPITTC